MELRATAVGVVGLRAGQVGDLPNLFGDGVDYEAARGVADVVEREAGYDGQDFAALRLQNANIAGIDDREGFDDVAIASGVRREIDLIARFQVLEVLEKRIAMSGDADVSGLTRECGARYVTYGSSERRLVHTFLDHCGDLQARNRNSPDDPSSAGDWRSLHATIRVGKHCGEDDRFRCARWDLLDLLVIELPILVHLIGGPVEPGLAVNPDADNAKDEKKQS
jgi:hypothetical protein